LEYAKAISIGTAPIENQNLIKYHGPKKMEKHWGYIMVTMLTMIKFVSELRQNCDFLRVLLFPPQITLAATMKLKYC
jgi:hypothetical protein